MTENRQNQNGQNEKVQNTLKENGQKQTEAEKQTDLDSGLYPDQYRRDRRDRDQ